MTRVLLAIAAALLALALAILGGAWLAQWLAH